MERRTLRDAPGSSGAAFHVASGASQTSGAISAASCIGVVPGFRIAIVSDGRSASSPENPLKAAYSDGALSTRNCGFAAAPPPTLRLTKAYGVEASPLPVAATKITPWYEPATLLGGPL